MAKNTVRQWDVTAANNTDLAGISIAENMATGAVNNAMREMMGQVRRDLRTYDTRADVATLSIGSHVRFIITGGYADADDGGGGCYAWVSSEPSHAGKVQSLDGAWWELTGQRPNVRQFGATGDGTTDDYQALADADGYGDAKGLTIVYPAGTYRTGSTLPLSSPVHFESGARIKPDSGINVSMQGYGSQDHGGGYWLDTSAGGGQTGRRQWDKSFYFANWRTANDKTTDESAILKEALIEFWAGDYSVFEGGGHKIGITDISIICGQDGMTSSPNATFQRGKVIRDLSLEWIGGTDSASQTTEYMLSIECPDSVVAGGAGFVELTFENVRFNMNGSSKNGLRFASFYEVYFRNCQWIKYQGGTAVFLDDQDNTSAYVSGNGAWFLGCVWDGEEFSAAPTGTPLLSYTGDVHVVEGIAQVSGAFDFHTGPAAVKGLHFSYRSSGGVDPMNIGIVFRDPREIMAAENDMDNAGILITNDGWAANTPGGQNAETNWRTIQIINNRVRLGDDPANFTGWCTVETHVASTTVRSIYVAGNTGGGGASEAITELYAKEVGSGTFSNFWKVHLHQGSFGWKNTGGLFDVASTSAGARTTVSDEEVQAPDFNFPGNRGSGITSNGSLGMCLRSNGSDQWEVISNGNFVPNTSGRNLGSPSNEVGDLYIQNAPTVSSDARLKDWYGGPTPDELAVAERLLRLGGLFSWRSGGDRRRRAGVLAQDVAAAFNAEGLNWRDYGVVVHDASADKYMVDYTQLTQWQLFALTNRPH